MQNFDEFFPQDKNIAYLNHAAVSPWPLPTQKAVAAFAEENTRIGATHYPRWLENEKQLRAMLCRLLHTSDPGEIALAKSTSEALSIIAHGLSWSAGDEIIITNHEFPSNRIAWESLADQGVVIRIADLNVDTPTRAIEKCISAKTRLLSISSVQYASGIKADLEALGKLCRQRNVLFCVDAIQSLGALPFNQQEIDADFIVADGHKWLMSAEGLALLYIKRRRQNELKLHQFGWHMVKHRGDYDRTDWEPANDATRFECGSPNMLGCHAMHASVGLLLEIGEKTILDELNKRVEYLIAALREIKGIKLISPIAANDRAGIVTFTCQGKDAKQLHQLLMRDRVVCANRGGGLRFSPHFYTPESTLKKAISCLKTHLNY